MSRKENDEGQEADDDGQRRDHRHPPGRALPERWSQLPGTGPLVPARDEPNGHIVGGSLRCRRGAGVDGKRFPDLVEHQPKVELCARPCLARGGGPVGARQPGVAARLVPEGVVPAPCRRAVSHLPGRQTRLI